MNSILAQISTERLAGHWLELTLLVLAAFGLLCVLSTMPRTETLRNQAIKWIGILIMVGCALVVFMQTPMRWETVLFYSFSGLALLGGIAFVCSRHPVYAACNFAVAVLSISGLLFMLNAAYLAISMMIVYAGATIIIFLFVLMFAQRSTLQIHDRGLNAPIIAVLFAAVLVALIGLGIREQRWEGLLSATFQDLPVKSEAKSIPDADSVAVGQDSSPAIGMTTAPHRLTVAGFGNALFTNYLWLVVLAGAMLTIAAIGAMYMAERHEPIMSSGTNELKRASR